MQGTLDLSSLGRTLYSTDASVGNGSTSVTIDLSGVDGDDIF